MKKTRSSRFKNLIGHRVRVARMAMKPEVSQEDLCGRLARHGIQLTQASLSKLENRQRYAMDYEIAEPPPIWRHATPRRDLSINRVEERYPDWR